MSDILAIILFGMIAVFGISFLGLGFYCRKNVLRWYRENGRYYSISTANTFWGICVLLSITNIGYMVMSLQDDNYRSFAVCCGIEAILVLTAFLIIKGIAKKKPEKGVFKILLYMFGTVWGIAFNTSLKLLGKGIDIMAEIEQERQGRRELLEDYCRYKDIRYNRISNDGYSYEDENGNEHRVKFYGDQVYDDD